MINIDPPNLADYYGFLVITHQDPIICDNDQCRSTNITTIGIISECNVCNYKWTTPASITAWPKVLRTAEGFIDNPVSTESIEAYIAKYNMKARFWKFITDYNDIPKDRIFRDALKCDVDGFGHHIEAAKFITNKIAISLGRNIDVANITTVDELLTLIK